MGHISQNLVAVQLETNHWNTDSVAFYAYFRQEPAEQDWREAEDSLSDPDGEHHGPLGLESAEPWQNREEVPNRLSQTTGLRRFFLGGAS